MANGLAGLIKKQKSQQAEVKDESANQDSGVEVPPTATSADSQAESVDVAKPKNLFARKATVATPPESTQETGAPEQKDDPAPSVEDSPKPKLAGFKFGAKAEESKPEVSDVSSLDDLADLDLDSLDEVRDDEPVRKSRFSDETPATKPSRTLPENMTDGDQNFVSLMDGVYDMIGDTELLGSVIKSIMVELKNNKQFARLISPDDARTWIRSMRDSMGLARIKKLEKKQSRGGSGSRKNNKVDADMLADLDDLGIDLS